MKNILPIDSHKQKIIDTIQKHRITIIIGSTGCGKTTQVPQYICKNITNANIVITQPRRVAAITVSHRVSEEMGCKIGEDVGYSVRFDSKYSDKTRIKYVTEGVLLRELRGMKSKKTYTHFILDEVHERTANMELLMYLLKEMMHKDDLNMKLILMSATIDEKAFKEYFIGAQIIEVPSQIFDVELFNTTKDIDKEEYLECVVNTIINIFNEEESGGILAFLTGQEEIEDALKILREKEPANPKRGCRLAKIMTLYPLFSALPKEQQIKAFEENNDPFNVKVILCTNIAETSVTIPGIKYVVDCGHVKKKIYNPGKNMDILTTVEIAQSSAMQRAGRAGRVCEGKCFRTYSLSQYEKMKPHSIPEIELISLTSTALIVKSLDIDFNSIKLMSKIPDPKKTFALSELFKLGAISQTDQRLSPLGIEMAKLPLDPIMSKLLLTAKEDKYSEVLNSVCKLVAMLSVENIRYFSKESKESKRKPQPYEDLESDHVTLVNIFDLKKDKVQTINSDSVGTAKKIYKELISLMELQSYMIKEKDKKDNWRELFLKCITEGLPLNRAVYQEDTKQYKTDTGLLCKIHPSSLIAEHKPSIVLYNEIVCTKANYMRHVSKITI